MPTLNDLVAAEADIGLLVAENERLTTRAVKAEQECERITATLEGLQLSANHERATRQRAEAEVERLRALDQERVAALADMAASYGRVVEERGRLRADNARLDALLALAADSLNNSYRMADMDLGAEITRFRRERAKRPVDEQKAGGDGK